MLDFLMETLAISFLTSVTQNVQQHFFKLSVLTYFVTVFG